MNFFHRLFNPHCPDCKLENSEKDLCQSCETYREQLHQVNEDKKKLLDIILELNKPTVPIIPIELSKEEIKPKYIPWIVKQQMLETEDRELARIMKKKTEELEKELGVSDAKV